jgi:hypothetical protein
VEESIEYGVWSIDQTVGFRVGVKRGKANRR